MANIYIAGRLYTIYQRKFLEYLESLLREKGHTVFLPHKHVGLFPHVTEKYIVINDLKFIENADIIIVVVDDIIMDADTMFEIGYAHAFHKNIILLILDFRVETSTLPIFLKANISKAIYWTKELGSYKLTEAISEIIEEEETNE